MSFRNRILDFRHVPACQLSANPKNWRRHPEAQREALRGVLEEIGYADACIARELPDGALELLDGHLRAGLDPDQEIPVLLVDLNDAEAAKLLVSLDPLAAMAEADSAALDSLLAEIETESAALKAMLDGLAIDASARPINAAAGPPTGPEPPAAETPSASSEAILDQFCVVVDCQNEDDQKAFYDRLKKEGRACRLLTL